MVSRGYEAPIADRSNWITVQPNVAIAAGWITVLIGAVLLTAQTATCTRGHTVNHDDHVESIRAEYVRYKTLAEAAIRQLDDAQLAAHTSENSNSVATICWHLAGNLKSRFTEFLTSDGEKPWRHREEEFQARSVTKAELLEKWEDGWAALLGALSELNDGQLHDTVTIRTAAAGGSRGAASFAGASGLPCRPNRLHCEVASGQPVDVFEHSTGQIRRVQPESEGEHAAGHTATLKDR